MSGRLIHIPLEDIVRRSELIVLAAPKSEPIFKETAVPNSENKYKWSLRDFEVLEIYKTGRRAVKLFDTLAISTFDSSDYKLEVMYAEGIRKIAIYKEYDSPEQSSVKDNEARILFLKEWTMEEYAPYNAMVYSIKCSYDSSKNSEQVKAVLLSSDKKLQL